MGTAHYYNSYSSEYNGDLTIVRGLSTVWFNPTGDPVGAEVEEVRFRFNLDNNGGSQVDLGDVDIWIVSPDGETNRIYYNFDGFGADGDDGNDSDAANDYDIYFSGTDLISSIKFGLDGNPVNGNWGLRIDNDTGITLDLNYLEVWVDYNTVPDLRVRDIQLSGVGGNEVGTPMLIETWIENTGDQRYGQKIDLEYLVNGQVIGTSELTFGLNGGSTNFESELYSFTQGVENDVTVRIVGATDANQSNNSLTKSFAFPQPDLVVTDVQVLGGWSDGDEVKIRTFIENIGEDAWNLLNGFIHVEYSVDGQIVGTDSLSLGLTPLFGDWESIDYTLTSDGPHTVSVRVYGDDPEVTLANNRWSERFGNDHDTGPQKTVANSADDVRLAAFMVHTVYGLDAIPEGFRGDNDNGLEDDYRAYLAQEEWTVLDDRDLGLMFRPKADQGYFTDGGLFVGDADDLTISRFNSQGLLAVNEAPEGTRTLALTFRGTDGDDMLDSALGQSFTGNGLYNYYEAMRPLVDAAIAYANDGANGIDKMVVSGHSLGGATADLFTVVDAHRLSGVIDLTVVSLASAGLHPQVLLDGYLTNGVRGQYDTSLAYFSDPGGDNEQLHLTAPSYYIGVSFTNDTVTFDRENPTSLPMVPNFVLNNNENFDDGLLAIDLPNVSATDPVDSDSPLASLNFGAEHDHGLYWAIVGLLAEDSLVSYLGGQSVIAGETDYAAIGTLHGDALAVFQKYVDAKPVGYENDTGSRGLIGTDGADYILGLGGNDALEGRGGNDLLSGGAGRDTLIGGLGDDTITGSGGSDRLFGNAGLDVLLGGGGRDKVIGGSGRDNLNGGSSDDLLKGGNGNDTLIGGTGDDTLIGGAGADQFIFAEACGSDLIKGYETGIDTLQVTAALWNGVLDQARLDALADTSGPDLVLHFDGGESVTLQGIGSTVGLLDDLVMV
ncbi:hypothetical protein [Thalassovita sp.]|uniref:hypothetical protein n=1 Tax=Thalassovita sp. TaxID=1979401 RepID=UPI0029DE8776|nr:hypothetical protein [Thalassovita sp.]